MALSIPREQVPELKRRLPIGAEYLGNGLTHMRVWAPAARQVEVVMTNRVDRTNRADPADHDRADRAELLPEDAGYHAGIVRARPGDRYSFQLKDSLDETRLYPDPASRFQPEGPHGASLIVDPNVFPWHDQAWSGVTLDRQVIYELHVGTFTREGSFAAAARELPELARIGVTMIEVMPIAEFEGEFGWGYDGVDLYAPSHLYGSPDDFRRFVEAAHAAGLAVILDVVYNHFGPVGNYLRAFSPSYFTDRHTNEWGESINFDGPDSGPVREFFIANAGYWIDEFHLDGLRLDATHQIFDQSPEHILAAIGRRARAAGANRPLVLIAENEKQEARLARPLSAGGCGLDGLWNDDFHHSAMVALTGRSEAYYSDLRGEPQELISAAKHGYLFQGQRSAWQQQPRGAPSWGLKPSAFVAYLQNHDQIANSATGRRGHELTSPGRWRAMTALLLLGPWTPLLFQGQEFQSSAPFLYFVDVEGALAVAIRAGRMQFLSQFPSVAESGRSGGIADPLSRSTFERCLLDLSERQKHREAYRLHEDLLRMRREEEVFGAPELGFDGCVLSASALALRFFTPDHRDDRLLLVNWGADLAREAIAEPLLAPPDETDWTIHWSSEALEYGGGGTPDIWPQGNWRIPGESALVLAPGLRRGSERPRTRRDTV